jgi:hypothetical protein
VELKDHVLCLCKLLHWQPLALLCCVNLVLDVVAEQVIPICTLEDLNLFIFFLTVYLSSQHGFRHAVLISYIGLMKTDVVDIVNDAILLQELHAIGLHNYMLNDLIGTVEAGV